MHWLLHDANAPSILEEAGYAYDSTLGYNETVGYRSGTTQVWQIDLCDDQGRQTCVSRITMAILAAN